MESNNPNLGNDVIEESTPDAEQTIADVQEAAEQPVDATSQAEITEDTEPQAEAAPVETEEPAVDASASADDDEVEEPAHAEDVPDVVEEEAEAAPVETEEPAVDASASADEVVAEEPAYTDEAPDVMEAEAEAAPVETEEPAVDASASADEVVAEEPAYTDEAPDVMEAEAEAEAAEPEVEEGGEAEPEPEPSKPPFRKGDVMDGTVSETSPTEVMIDLGEGYVGVVASRELERMDRDALAALEIGNSVSAYVLKVRGSDGRPVLSLARAEEENNWRMAEEYYETKQVYFSKVAGYNKGGLIVRFGKVRGFVPASQVSRERQSRAGGSSPEERWGHMVGDDIAVKVVEIDRSRNRLILSERAAAREWRERQKARLIEELNVGDVRTGRVISIADFGAFVDLGGADGLVHLTEISWQHVTHPRDVLEVGQEVEVLVINIDQERKRIGLSMKRLEDDPWTAILKDYEVGQLVQANVTKLTKFGAFARLIDSPEIEGLIHISELADYRVSHPKEVVLVGDVLTLRIVKISPEQRRLGLSLRQVDSARYMDQDWQAIYDEIEETEDLDVSDDAPPSDEE